MKKTWNQHLREAFERRGFAQKDVAAALGVSKGTVSHWVAGNRNPSIKTINDLARLLRMTYSEMLGDDVLFVSEAIEKEALLALRGIPPEQQQVAVRILQQMTSQNHPE
jgi:transcriptional regulator with XRE-family HTH domain